MFFMLGIFRIKKDKKGVIKDPTTKIITPTLVYVRLYNFIKPFKSLTSLFASGLYILYTIAGPIPNSAKERIDNIFENPKRFIVSQDEILNIEKSKKVGVETVKHLSKHTNFISEVDEETGDIKPEKLLNELKEETFNTYENRFIYT